MAMQGRELRAIRQQLGWKQVDMASALGVSPTFVGLMERDAKPIERRTEQVARQLSSIPRLRALRDGLVERNQHLRDGLYRITRTDASGAYDLSSEIIAQNERSIAEIDSIIEEASPFDGGQPPARMSI